MLALRRSVPVRTWSRSRPRWTGLPGSLLRTEAGTARWTQVAGLLTGGMARKVEEHRGLIRALHGRPARAQPRDEHGRFRGGMDGGARRLPPRPPESHDQWLVRALRSRSADVGALPTRGGLAPSPDVSGGA